MLNRKTHQKVKIWFLIMIRRLDKLTIILHVLKYPSIAIASNIAVTILLLANSAPVYSQEQHCENAATVTANEYTDQNTLTMHLITILKLDEKTLV